MNFQKSIFRKYDIRGIADTEIADDLVFAIAYTYAQCVKEVGATKIAIGRDCRVSSPRIHKALLQGLNAVANLEILDIGICTTPLLSFASYYLDDCRFGIMITASHNPKQYNGFKFIFDNGVYQDNIELPDKILNFKRQIQQALATKPVFSKSKNVQIQQQYFEFIKQRINLKQCPKIIFDGSNGPSGKLALKLFDYLGFQVSGINCEYDGNFPNHNADTSAPDNYLQLIDKVKTEKADIGILFDGDGDRFAAVASNGDIIWPDSLLILMAEPLVKQNPNAKVVYDVKCSEYVTKAIKSFGGIPVMTKTGRAHIFKIIKQQQSLLAGEYSGHFFYSHNWITTDDALYAVCRLLQSNAEVSLEFNTRVANLPKSYSIPELLIAMADSIKPKFIEQCKQNIGQLPHIKVDYTDGMRVTFDKGWSLVRYSNTTPAITLRVEADSEQDLLQIQQQFINFCKNVATAMDLPWQVLQH